MSSHTLNNVIGCVRCALLDGQNMLCTGLAIQWAGKVQYIVVGGSYGIQMFHTSKIKEEADNSSLETDAQIKSLSSSLWLFAF